MKLPVKSFSVVIDLYKEYNLMRDDIESIAELSIWPGMKDPGAAIPVKVLIFHRKFSSVY